MQTQQMRTLLRWGGLGALCAAAAFLLTLLYVFGFLASMGLTEEMLDTPAQLLPWVATHTQAYAGIYWIFLFSVISLLPTPVALHAWVHPFHPALARIGVAAGLIGVTLGVIGPLVNVGITGLLANAYVNTPDVAPATLVLLSAIVGEMGLLLRLSSDLFLGIWLGLTGCVLVRGAGRPRGFGWYTMGLAFFILIVVVGKALTLLDLEPVLGLFLAIAYGWLGLLLWRKGATLPAETRDSAL